jgi:hypothetical protein
MNDHTLVWDDYCAPGECEPGTDGCGYFCACESGYDWVAGACVAQCPEDEVRINGVCTPKCKEDEVRVDGVCTPRCAVLSEDEMAYLEREKWGCGHCDGETKVACLPYSGSSTGYRWYVDESGCKCDCNLHPEQCEGGGNPTPSCDAGFKWNALALKCEVDPCYENPKNCSSCDADIKFSAYPSYERTSTKIGFCSVGNTPVDQSVCQRCGKINPVQVPITVHSYKQDDEYLYRLDVGGGYKS